MSRDKLTGFLGELMRRKVVRVAIGYSLIGWLLMQIAEVTFEPLGLPGWTLTLLIVLGIMGFFVAVVLAWAFEVTPEGLKRESAIQRRSEMPAATRGASYRSVAVLPFADMSPGKDQGYFCEGIAEEILNTLSKVRTLHVPARTSSFRFSTDSHDVREIGKALNVDAILEGSVRKDGDILRITAQLIDARNGYHIWANSYDRHLSSFIELQQHLSEEIMENLSDSLDRHQIFHQDPLSMSNIDAYDFYLQGQYYLNRHNQQSGEFAVKMFTKATRLDNRLSPAWAGLAEALAYLYLHHEAMAAYRKDALSAADEAVALAPDSARCRTARGLALTIVGRYTEADDEFKRAVALDDARYSTFYHYGRSCQLQGRLAKAVEMFEKAASRRPEDYQAPLLAMSIYRRLGDAERARVAAQRGIEAAKEHLSFHPDDSRALYLGSLGLLELGERDKGAEWAERALELDDRDSLTRYNVACFYAQAGDREKALGNLSEVRLFGEEFGDWIRNDPDLDPVRADERFRRLVEAAA